MNALKRNAPPALLLEQLQLGELTEKQHAALRDEFGDAALQEACVALARQDAAMRPQLPTLKQWKPLLPPEKASKPLGFFNLLPISALGAAVIATLGVLSSDVWPSRTLPAEQAVHDNGQTRSKGLAPELLLFRKEGEIIKPLADGEQAKAGDVLQLAYVGAGQRFGTIVSVDGRGTVTVHYPETAGASTELGPGRVLLGHAYRLDDAPYFEHFLFITARAPIDVAAAQRALAAAAEQRSATGKPPRLPKGLSGYQVTHLTLYKDK